MNVFDDLVDNILIASAKTPRDRSPFTVGTVIGLHAGESAAGRDLVAVQWMGTSIRAMYDDRLALEVGDVVLLARTQPMTVLIRLAGPATSI